MTAAPVAFESRQGLYQFLGVTQLVNAYAEKQGPNDKGPLAVLPCEGMVSYTTNGSAPCRGLIHLPDLSKVYAIHNSAAYRVTTGGTSLEIGIVPGTDQVQLSRNQKADPQVVVQTAAGVQVIESDSLSYITDTDLTSVGTVTSADFVGGYTVALFVNRQFFISALNNSKTWDALDFATFEQRAGKGVRVMEDNGELIGLCSEWMEFWRDTGNADFPFEPIGFKSRGLKGPQAVCRCDNTLMFVGDDNNVYRLDNYNPVIISNHRVSRLIQADTAPENIIAFSFDRGGHKFAYFKGTNWTEGFDAATQTWHSRESYGYDRWRAQHSVQAFGKTLLGDGLSGKLFYLDKDTYTEDSGTMIWKVVSPPLHVFPNGAILDAVHFDLATGYGTLSGQGSDPKVMLRVSVDGGNTFGQYRELSLSQGDKGARVTARRLGRFGPKGIVFELSISDPVARALVGCDIELRPLKR